MPGELVYLTKCKLCSKTFRALGVAVADNTPSPATIEFVLRLDAHIEHEHRRQYLDCVLAGREMQGLKVILNYDSQDPQFNPLVHSVRWKIHQRTKIRHVPDERLIHKAAELCARLNRQDAEAQNAAFQMLAELRNILEELPPYTPENTPVPEPPLVLTVPK